MNKVKAFFSKIDDYSFIIGLVIVLVPVFIDIYLGSGSIFSYHDQLDGEILTYILGAKYFLSGAEIYPELFNGIPSTGLTPAAPALVLLYKLFSFGRYPYLYALIFSFALGTVTAYVGMYKLLGVFIPEAYICALCAVFFSFVPHLCVYGLSITGLPLLLYAFISIKISTTKSDLIYAYAAVVFFGLFSSLPLVGFAVIGIAFVYILFSIAAKKFNFKFLSGVLLLLVVYVSENTALLKELLGISNDTGFQSHRIEIVRKGMPFAEGFISSFYFPSLHLPTHQKYMFPVFGVLILTLTALYIKYRKEIFEDKKAKTAFVFFVLLFAFNVFTSILYGFIHWYPTADFRNRTGGIIHSFQFDRINWLSDPVWYILFGLCIYLLLYFAEGLLKNGFAGKLIKIFVFTYIVFISITIFKSSDLNKGIHALYLKENYSAVSFEEYYASDIFSEIDEYIQEKESLQKTEYRTLSLGLYPAIASYNGFYTLDGYSNNYPLEYKKTFRKIIAKELDKNPELKAYYDDWGNRVYLITGSLSQNWLIPKGSGIAADDLELDFKAAYELGARYLFSAVEISKEAANRLGLELMRKEPFAGTFSYYEIYLYKIRFRT